MSVFQSLFQHIFKFFNEEIPTGKNDGSFLRILCSPVVMTLAQIWDFTFILFNTKIQICCLELELFDTFHYSQNKYFVLNKRSVCKLSSPEVICRVVLFGFKFKPLFSLSPRLKDEGCL